MPREDVALVEAGEATGNLDKTLDGLAERHDARRAARRRFLTDAWYPLILFHLATFLTPIPFAFAKDGHLFGWTWLRTVLWILVPAYGLLLVVIRLGRTAGGRALLRRIVDWLPGFGNAARHRRRADFADVLGAAYDAGVKLDKALELAGGSVHEPRIAIATQVVAKGGTLRDALGGTGFLPAPLVGQVAVGEQAGDLTRVLRQIAAEEAEAADHMLKRSTTLLAKAIYIGVALWILFYAVSSMVAYYSNVDKLLK